MISVRHADPLVPVSKLGDQTIEARRWQSMWTVRGFVGQRKRCAASPAVARPLLSAPPDEFRRAAGPDHGGQAEIQRLDDIWRGVNW
jgi:hypothetical protein